ncbi:MAG: hypothetical protein ABF811_00470 [Pseudoclavibacter sp.]
MQIIGVVFERSGFAAAAEQCAALGAVDAVRDFRVLTDADAEAAWTAVRDSASAGDVVVVSSLAVLGFGSRPLLSAVAALAEAGVDLVAVAEGVDTRVQSGFLAAATQLEAGVQAARRADAVAVIDRASHRGAQTPPKAEFIPVEFADLVPADRRLG